MKKFPVVTVVSVVAGVALLIVATFLCIKPYDVPEYVEVDSSESAFLIPLEGDTANQATFQSVKFLEEKKVAAKRVQITHRWSQTGWLPRSGQWIGTVRLIKVDRRPITREWTRSPKSGTSSRDEAIAAESKDSINFNIGVSCTAHIAEDADPMFLYSYPSKSLAEMLDMEVRARIHQIIAEEAGRYVLFDLPAKKNDIINAVRDDVLPFFKKKGIEITTLAMLGGLTFDNPEIQKAIDDAAKAAQLKVAAEGKRAAQEVENKTLLLAAEGKAQAAKRDAESKVEVDMVRADGEAKTRLRAAEAEAQSTRKLVEAKAFEAQQAMQMPDVYLRLKTLEVEAGRWKQWDGKFPTSWIVLGSQGLNSAWTLPTLPALDAEKTAARPEARK